MNFAPKKSLGQNFLLNKQIIKDIVELGQITNENTVIEIGPGTGNLTEEILKKKPKKFFAIEKDQNLYFKLKDKFQSNLELINQDVLNVDWNNFSNSQCLVFGNLPYNISAKLLIDWIRLNNLNTLFKKFILMFQKEVAERIIAETDTKNYGRLAVLSSWKLKIEKVIDVSPGSFYPIPKVKSTVLLIKPKNEYFNLKNPKNLEHITNIFFNQRRKMIKKPLNIIFKNVNEISNKLDININDRPQNLSSLKYFEICKEFENLNS